LKRQADRRRETERIVLLYMYQSTLPTFTMKTSFTIGFDFSKSISSVDGVQSNYIIFIRFHFIFKINFTFFYF